jgi:hypothetical protein
MTRITIPYPIVRGMFAECDKYPTVETGGRLLGFYNQTRKGLWIEVRAVLPAGPKARRTAISFFNDGEYQERLFRSIEAKHPQIDHLGNWHSHHCNGLETLSDGDRTTYVNTVNSPKHNTDFFLSLLVIKPDNYKLKAFLAFRRSSQISEVTDSLDVSRKLPILDL